MEKYGFLGLCGFLDYFLTQCLVHVSQFNLLFGLKFTHASLTVTDKYTSGPSWVYYCDDCYLCDVESKVLLQGAGWWIWT